MRLACPRCTSTGRVVAVECRSPGVVVVIEWSREGRTWRDEPWIDDLMDERSGCGYCPPLRRTA